jgi:hypothetical protein
MIDRGFEVPIDTVDRWRLATPVRWLIMRVFARDCVEQVALQHYVRALLETHRWSLARRTPS